MNFKKLGVIAVASVLVSSIVVFLAVSPASNNSANTSASTSGGQTLVHKVSFDTAGGGSIPDLFVEHGEKISEPTNVEKTGYKFENWYFKDFIWNFNYRVEQDMTLTAHWNIVYYSITYDFDGGTATEQSYKTTYTVLSDFSLVGATKESNVFAGWFDSNNRRFDSIKPGETGDIIIKARWLNNFVFVNTDPSRGVIKCVGSEEKNNKVILSSEPVNNKYHLFKGWYDNNGSLISNRDQFVYTLKSDEINYVYAKYLDDNEENLWNISHAVYPSFDSSKTFIYYGLYPKSLVDNVNLVGILDSLNPTKFNNYICYNNEYYVKKKTSLYNSQNITFFDNGYQISDGADYWYKVEPLKWRLLDNNDNELMLLSEYLIDAYKFYTGSSKRTIDEETILPNNYEYSTLRKWQNGYFYENAFFFGADCINENEIDNSASTTMSADIPFACNNTIDKVFSLSYADYLNPNYGFSSSQTSYQRRSKTTDYSRTSNIAIGDSGDNQNCGYYWTRSPALRPGDVEPVYVSRCNKNGTLNYDYLAASYMGVRPAIYIANNNYQVYF